MTEYFDEFEHLRNRLEIDDSEESLMAQFLDGLQEPIARKLERQPYHDLGKIYHLAVQIEQSNKRKSSAPSRPRTTWNAGSKPFEQDAPTVDQKLKGKVTSTPVQALKVGSAAQRTAPPTAQPQRSRDITCFKCSGRGHMSRDCPNQRVMFINAAGEYKSEEEREEAAPAVDTVQSDEEIAYADSGEMLMI